MIRMPYTESYEIEILRGINETRPWDLISEISKVFQSQHKLLDIGCGTATKLIQLASVTNYQRIIGVEPNERMRCKAEENIRFSNLDNISVINGLAESLPFEDQAFDIVTAMVAPHDTSEVHRVLKPGGHAIIEKIGDRDKWNLKVLFGQDGNGLRGQFCDYDEGEREIEFEEEFSRLFTEVSTKNGFWKTYYSVEGLILLLEQTPTIRSFDREKDYRVVEKIAEIFMTEKGILTTQNRILVTAKK